jgi:phosphoglycerate-specific signal transduction histidine kinase
MTPDDALRIAVIGAIASVLAALASPFVVQWFGRRKAKTDSDLNIGESAKAIAEGGETAVNAMREVLTFYKARIDEMEKSLSEYRLKVTTMEALITSMQIDWKAREASLLVKIEALEQYIRLLVNILRAHDWEIPPRPDTLKDSDPNIKALK